MSEIKKSLEENKDAILENLPAELHEAFETELAAAADAPPPGAEDEGAAIQAEAAAHPEVDESLVSDVDPAAHRADAPPSADEQKSAMKAELEKVGELTEPEGNYVPDEPAGDDEE